jgi:outer membrane protein TolC
MNRLFRVSDFVALSAWLLTGCASSYLERAPRSPARAWPLPSEPSFHVGVQNGPTLRSDHLYSLLELIDIAEAANPDTRISWEHARQAALAVGVANAGYYPLITAWTIAGYQHTLFPVPTGQANIGTDPFPGIPSASFPITALQQSGHVGVDTYQILPFVSILWKAFDLGRADEVKAAEHLSDAANSLFTAEHQRIIFEVARAYYRLGAARAMVAGNREALERTRSIAQGAEARYEKGIATVVEVSEARREVAQAEYNLAQAQAGEVIASASLISVMGIEPVAQLRVATGPSRDLPARLDQKVDAYVEAAIQSRADLRAARARLPSTEAQVSRSKAAYAPRISLSGTAGAAIVGANVGDLPSQTLTLPNVTALATLEWTVFDQGLRDIQTALARSQHDEAVQQLIKLEHQTSQEVISAYNELNANLSRFGAATELLKTATVAEEAAEKSYTNGLATLTDAMSAQKARALASAAKDQSFADALVSSVTLAFASGQLISARAVPYSP